MHEVEGEYGGFQYVADRLSEWSRRSYSPQAVRGLWQRGREGKNNFPDRKKYVINGNVKYYFDMKTIQGWYENVSKDNTYGKRYR